MTQQTLDERRVAPPGPTDTGVRGRGTIRTQLGRLPLRLAVALLLVIEVVPLVWLLLSSLKQEREFSGRPVWSLPEGLYWRNYERAFTVGNMGVYLKNSIVATFPSLAAILLLSVAAAFGLEVMKWRGRNGVLLLFLAGIMIPLQMVLLPLFTAYFKLHLIDNLLSLIITYTAFGLPLSIFLMVGYYRVISRDVLEAAAIDGAGVLRTFAQITVPMVRNAILTIGLVQFFFIWNDLLISLTFTTNDDLRTIQVGLLNFTGQYGETAYGPLFAAISINVVGALVLYLLINQRIIKGLTAGAVKG
jgi:raffinose/stachyose/melibiose transport system permease protein